MEDLRLFYDKVLNGPKKFKLLWNLDTKRSQWVKTTDDILKAMQVNNSNMFFGVGMTDKAYGPTRRATAAQVTTMCCVYLDIDIASDNEDVHSKKNLPANLEEALEIAYKFLQPTFIVFSGHGIHPYYCFSDTVDLKKNGKYFGALLRQFQMAHRKAFPQYQLDYTHDFARVLRCPGTFNNKDPQNPVKCKIIESNDVDYWLEEIEDAIEFNPDLTFETNLPFDKTDAKNKETLNNPEQALSLSSTQEFIEWFDGQGLELDPNASLDAETWVELEQATNGKLGEIYSHKKNTSVDISTIDLSLANLGAKNCLSDQQIVDLMVMHRRKYGVKPYKLLRKDYYARTLIKAVSERFLENIRKKKTTYTQKAVSREMETPEPQSAPIILSTKRTVFSQHTPSDKQNIRKHIKDLLNVEIKRITCYPKDPEPVFEMELADMPGRVIQLGTYQTGIMSQANFRATIASLGMSIPNKVPKDVWDPVVLEDLRVLTEEGDIPETSTYDGQIKIFLRDYLKTKTIEDEKEGVEKEYPHMSKCGTKVVFQADQFRRWLNATKGMQISFSLESAMMQSGFSMNGSLYTTSPYFYIPADYVPPPQPPEKTKT